MKIAEHAVAPFVATKPRRTRGLVKEHGLIDSISAAVAACGSKRVAMPRLSPACSTSWAADDRVPERRARLAGNRPYRHAEGLRRLIAAGPEDAEARSARRSGASSSSTKPGRRRTWHLSEDGLRRAGASRPAFRMLTGRRRPSSPRCAASVSPHRSSSTVPSACARPCSWKARWPPRRTALPNGRATGLLLRTACRRLATRSSSWVLDDRIGLRRRGRSIPSRTRSSPVADRRIRNA